MKWTHIIRVMLRFFEDILRVMQHDVNMVMGSMKPTISLSKVRCTVTFIGVKQDLSRYYSKNVRQSQRLR
jgi:hypothetical protein